MQALKNLISTFGILIFIFAVAVVAWFIPWVFSLHTGLLIYFPYEEDGKSRFVRVTGPLWHAVGGEWLPGDKIPKACKSALVAAEDTRFYDHIGVDFESLEKSYNYNKKKNRVRRGGSTLTQQLVKNAFLSRDRSYIRKAREITGAMLLDATMSKDSQLNWYFNIVEFGPRTYGLQAAAQKYFKKDAENLSLKECVSLVAILPSPNKWNKSLVKKSYSSFFASRTSVIQARMRIMGTYPGARLAAKQQDAPENKESLSIPPLPDLPGGNVEENADKDLLESSGIGPEESSVEETGGDEAASEGDEALEGEEIPATQGQESAPPQDKIILDPTPTQPL